MPMTRFEPMSFGVGRGQIVICIQPYQNIFTVGFNLKSVSIWMKYDQFKWHRITRFESLKALIIIYFTCFQPPLIKYI